MSTRLLILTFFIFFISSITLKAQKLEYDFTFQGIGDNREYKPEYGFSQTIIGERTSFELGTTIEDIHQIRIGLSHFYEFGAPANYNKPQITAYYRFKEKNTQFYFGAFPRIRTIDFPLAIISDTIQYYKPNIEGLLARHNWSWGREGNTVEGHQIVFIDWTGKRLANNREKFFAATSGKINYKNLFFENFISLYHHALSQGGDINEHISDNFGYNINLGYNFKCNELNYSYLKIGVLGSALRERNVNEEFITGTSFFNEIFITRKNIALRNTIMLGNGQNFLTGDKFYQQDNYMRSDFTWTMIRGKNILVSFTQSFHFINWNSMSNQQKITLFYNINR